MLASGGEEGTSTGAESLRVGDDRLLKGFLTRVAVTTLNEEGSRLKNLRGYWEEIKYNAGRGDSIRQVEKDGNQHLKDLLGIFERTKCVRLLVDRDGIWVDRTARDIRARGKMEHLMANARAMADQVSVELEFLLRKMREAEEAEP